MSEISIENMPEEVLADIFKWLDQESLKNAVLTSKNWQGIIERNIPWSLNLRRINGGRIEPWMDPMLASNRKFHKVIIFGLSDSLYGLRLASNELLEIFTKHGGNIRQLSLFYCIIDNATIWCQVLETMPKLKKLVMKGAVAFETFEDIPAELKPALQKLPQLKTLEMVDSSVELLKFFENCQLQTLKILYSSDDDQPREPLLNLLATQKDLEVLTLKSIHYKRSKLFESPIPAKFIPFKLKKLSLLDIKLRETPNDYNNLMEFMKSHMKTLDELELGRSFPDFFIEFVVAKFKNLKTLSLMESAIPRDVGFYERLEVNENVTNLQLTGEETSSDIAFTLKHLVSHLPNIELMSLFGSFDNSVAKHIAENLKELKDLTVESFNGQTFDGVQFHALQSLRILNFNASIDWDAFTKANPGIIDLSIKSIWEPQDLDIQTITANLKIHKLTIEDNEMNCDAKFFNVIRENCPELKSLKLHAFAKKVDISTIADIPGLRFRDSDYFVEQYNSEGNFWKLDYNSYWHPDYDSSDDDSSDSDY